MRSAAAPTDGDVTVLLDGRRMDSRESVGLWLTEVATIRELESPPHHSVV